MGTKLERQQSKQIEFIGKTWEEKEQALKEMTRALRASEKLLHQEQMKNKKMLFTRPKITNCLYR
ncbi:MAG: hypothetical protein LBG45_07385 [Dysgonamonadaceae bacterium]|jgi:hypothetical protein|nr:hypothetical protein [Dysgonamonadaceae bacterium]